VGWSGRRWPLPTVPSFGLKANGCLPKSGYPDIKTPTGLAIAYFAE